MNGLVFLRNLLQKFVDDIDNGNCNLTKEELDLYIDELAKFNTQNAYMSKTQACEYLHMSRPTFDRLVSEGKIPHGEAHKGLKELTWSRCSLDKVCI